MSEMYYDAGNVETCSGCPLLVETAGQYLCAPARNPISRNLLEHRQTWCPLKHKPQKKCAFCSDLRNIEPAHSLWLGDEEGNIEGWLQEARDNKNFVHVGNVVADSISFTVIDKCPVCGYVFTEEDYDQFTTI